MNPIPSHGSHTPLSAGVPPYCRALMPVPIFPIVPLIPIIPVIPIVLIVPAVPAVPVIPVVPIIPVVLIVPVVVPLFPLFPPFPLFLSFLLFPSFPLFSSFLLFLLFRCSHCSHRSHSARCSRHSRCSRCSVIPVRGSRAAAAAAGSPADNYQLARRRTLQVVAGFESAEKAAVETLTEMIQSCECPPGWDPDFHGPAGLGDAPGAARANAGHKSQRSAPNRGKIPTIGPKFVAKSQRSAPNRGKIPKIGPKLCKKSQRSAPNLWHKSQRSAPNRGTNPKDRPQILLEKEPKPSWPQAPFRRALRSPLSLLFSRINTPSSLSRPNPSPASLPRLDVLKNPKILPKLRDEIPAAFILQIFRKLGGHTARTQPTLSDIVVTLVEMGEQLPLPTLSTFGLGNLPSKFGIRAVPAADGDHCPYVGGLFWSAGGWEQPGIPLGELLISFLWDNPGNSGLLNWSEGTSVWVLSAGILFPSGMPMPRRIPVFSLISVFSLFPGLFPPNSRLFSPCSSGDKPARDPQSPDSWAEQASPTPHSRPFPRQLHPCDIWDLELEQLHPGEVWNWSCPVTPPSRSLPAQTYREPVSDYQVLREKAASQRRDVERALTRFMAKTGETQSLFKDDVSTFPRQSFPDFPSLLGLGIIPCVVFALLRGCVWESLQFEGLGKGFKDSPNGRLGKEGFGD
ncbi:hypothetical protein DV515_00018290 [Chloebia gouldiae]|uniref:Transcription initiation factor TFIID subunit 8 n=1 Tax=Chloebia gouldiae TaxID=44316 RepID=A0A3L8Q7X1_CHLGU|nr:hypothetical protein DV515_00018290 [Chloebia gouldiae]